MSIEAMKLALEALETYQQASKFLDVCNPAITALRQAIEQAQKRPAPMSEPNRIVAYSAAEKLRSLGYQWDEKAAAWQAQKQEPVTYPENFIDALRYNTALREFEYEQAQKQDPVAWMHWLHGPVRLFLNKDEATMELDRLNREYPVDADGRKMRPLVFGDTSPPQRQPLTDEEIEAAFKKCGGRWNGDHWVIEDADLHPFVRAIESPELNTLRAISDEYNAWIRHHAAGHTYDDFLATRKAAHGIKGKA